MLDYELKRQTGIIENIQDGLTCSIRYEIKIYKLGQGILKRLGRSLVYKKIIEYEGEWDPFLSSYLISDGENTFFHDGPDDFLNNFFSLKNIPVEIEFEGDKEYQVQVRSNLSRINLYPPLNIMTPFIRLEPEDRSRDVIVISSDRGENE